MKNSLFSPVDPQNIFDEHFWYILASAHNRLFDRSFFNRRPAKGVQSTEDLKWVFPPYMEWNNSSFTAAFYKAISFKKIFREFSVYRSFLANKRSLKTLPSLKGLFVYKSPLLSTRTFVHNIFLKYIFVSMQWRPVCLRRFFSEMLNFIYFHNILLRYLSCLSKTLLKDLSRRDDTFKGILYGKKVPKCLLFNLRSGKRFLSTEDLQKGVPPYMIWNYSFIIEAFFKGFFSAKKSEGPLSLENLLTVLDL